MSDSKWLVWGAAAVALLGVSGALAMRRTTRAFTVTSTIARNKAAVFELHATPASFYRVLEFKRRGDKGYTVLSVSESPDRTSLSYELSHASAFGTIRSRPLRTAIVRSGAVLSFSESFVVIGTTLQFNWRFVDTPNVADSTDVRLDIALSGPAISCAFLARVKADFEARFETTNEHLDALIPPHHHG